MLGHRLDLVEEADQVVVLQRGQVLAAGTPDRIREICGGATLITAAEPTAP